MRKPIKEKSMQAPQPEAEAPSAPKVSAKEEAEQEEKALALALAKIQAAQEEPAQSKPYDPFDDPDASLETLLSTAKDRDDLLRIIAIRRQRETVVKEVKPIPLTARQQSKLEAEQAAGRRASQRHAERTAFQDPVKRSPDEIKATPTSTPVARQGDYVPDMQHGYTQVRAGR